MRVIVNNESDSTLRLGHDWTSGDWTPGGWQPSQFSETPPGGSLQWQAEGESVADVALSGVEARAWYDVIDPAGANVGELYIFANSPWVESQYGNTFHVYAPKGYYAAYVDAYGQKKGNRAILEISFRNTRRVEVPGFHPSINGFQFANHWSDELPVVTLGSLWNRFRNAIPGDLADTLGIGTVAEDWLPITHADSGLCGGMVYTVMDYFNARQLPPTAAKDAHNNFVPPDSSNDLLFQHVRQRLLDSFDFTGRGSRWLSYTSPVYPDDDEGVLQTLGLMKGKSWVTYREEWPRIRELLDRGQLAPLGLVQSAEFDIGANHQVLAYAYRQDAQVVQLWIYDPNVPGQEAAPAIADDLYLEFDITDTSNGITVTRHNCRVKDYEKRIYAILYMDNYAAHVAPFGQPFPPLDQPKVVNLHESDSESVTTGGTATSERTSHCGDILKIGHWISKTTTTFVVQVSGYLNPTVNWKVNGDPLAPENTSYQLTENGHTYRVGCQLNVGGRSLTLSSESGDSYKISVAVDVADMLGNAGHAETVFEVEGEYDGMRIEDIRAEAQCIAKSIPVPVDIAVFTVPKDPEPDPDFDIQKWKQATLEKVQADPSINPGSYAAIKSYVDLQANTPEFLPLAQNIAKFKRIL